MASDSPPHLRDMGVHCKLLQWGLHLKVISHSGYSRQPLMGLMALQTDQWCCNLHQPSPYATGPIIAKISCLSVISQQSGMVSILGPESINQSNTTISNAP